MEAVGPDAFLRLTKTQSLDSFCITHTFIPLVAQCCSGARAQRFAFLGFPRRLMESVTLELAWNLLKHGEVLTAKTGQEPQSLEPAGAK